MSVFFIGDPHLGHRAIAKYRPFVTSSEHNTALVTEEWRATINKKDVVYVMGDAAFDYETLALYGDLPGRKILIKGNHDDMVSTHDQLDVFEEIHGMLKYKSMWLTHCPMHPDELRGRPNVHGHVHLKSICRYGTRLLPDDRYLNTCVDVIYPKYGRCLITLDEVKDYFKSCSPKIR